MRLLMLVGFSEMLLGALVLIYFRYRWPLVLTILLMGLATVGVVVNSPRYLNAAFNPISLNLLMTVVAVMGLVGMKDLPSAKRCLRKKPEVES